LLCGLVTKNFCQKRRFSINWFPRNRKFTPLYLGWCERWFGDKIHKKYHLSQVSIHQVFSKYLHFRIKSKVFFVGHFSWDTLRMNRKIPHRVLSNIVRENNYLQLSGPIFDHFPVRYQFMRLKRVEEHDISFKMSYQTAKYLFRARFYSHFGERCNLEVKDNYFPSRYTVVFLI